MNEYNIGDVVTTKKNHPCGGNEWKVLRIGVDFKLQCTQCNHVIMIEREKALKMISKKTEKN